MFVFKAWLAVLKLIFYFSFCLSYSLPLNETSSFFWFASSSGSLWFFPTTQIIENLPAGLFPPNLKELAFHFWVAFLIIYLDFLNSSKLEVCGKSPSSWLQFLGVWVSISPSTLVDFMPLLREESLQWGEKVFFVFLRTGGWSESLLHLRDMYSHSPQCSVFEVSGIRGPAFLISIPPITPLFQLLWTNASLETNIIQLAVYPVLYNGSSCIFCYKCFRCYYLIFLKFSYPCKQKKILHLGLRP